MPRPRAEGGPVRMAEGQKGANTTMGASELGKRWRNMMRVAGADDGAHKVASFERAPDRGRGGRRRQLTTGVQRRAEEAVEEVADGVFVQGAEDDDKEAWPEGI